jgi:hypothetical protein
MSFVAVSREFRHSGLLPLPVQLDDVRAVLAAADLAAERTAARVRLCVLILIGLVLVGLGSVAGVYREWIATSARVH